MHIIRKLIVGFVIMILLVPLTPFASAQRFSDLPTNGKYFDVVDQLSNAGVIRGYPDGSFSPNGLINRAEATKILIAANYSQDEISRALDIYKANNWDLVQFDDVKTTQWFAPYIARSEEHTSELQSH